MWHYTIKVLVTAFLVVVIAEISKRWTFMGAIVASLPLTSLLAMIWLYVDTKSTEKVVALSYGIFWVVIPSLVFFIAFPLLIKWNEHFWWSLLLSCAVTAVSYIGYLQVLSRFGVSFD